MNDDKLIGIGALALIAIGWMVVSALGKPIDKTVIVAIVSAIAGFITGRR